MTEWISSAILHLAPARAPNRAREAANCCAPSSPPQAMRNLFCVASTGGLLPLSFQLLLKNLLGSTLMNCRKVLQWQRSNHRPDIEIDPLNGKHSAGV